MLSICAIRNHGRSAAGFASENVLFVVIEASLINSSLKPHLSDVFVNELKINQGCLQEGYQAKRGVALL